MDEKHVCEDCKREFQNSESMSQHRQAKHVVHPSSAPPKKKFPVKAAVFVVALLLVAGAYFVFASSNGTEKPLVDPSNPTGTSELQKMLEFNLRQHSGNLAQHIHPVLTIDILGQSQDIPANIGITSKGMRAIHTHDATGGLHIETPQPFLFHLQDFFTIWEKDYNATCIFGYCADDTHSLSVYVNDVKSQEWNVPLRDKDRILIVYDRKQ